MSVLTVTGTSAIPEYTRPAIVDYRQGRTVSSLAGPAPLSNTPTSTSTTSSTYSYTRPDRRSNNVRLPQTQLPPAHHHARISSVATTTTTTASPLHRGLSSSQPQSRSSYSPSNHSRQSSTASIPVNMQRQPTAASMGSSVPRRSTSGRSVATNSPTSYVALMRKQKATVWCDRAQTTDVRTEAARRAAKHRAQLAVQSSANATSARTSTLSSGGVVGKIRHGGVPKAPGYVPANMSGAGVPMRLSANEMLGDEEEEPGYVRGDNQMVHGRSGSGNSSTSSAKYRSGYPRPDQGRFSANSTPSGDGSPSAKDRIPEESHQTPNPDYYATREKKDSTDEDSFGELREMAGPNSAIQAANKAKNSEDLRRRGSVDERAMSMGAGVKLFVANPDIDSD
jgi:hypothetical protein